MKTPAAPADPTHRGGTLSIDRDPSPFLDPQDQSTSDRVSKNSLPLGVHPLGSSHLPNQLNQHHFQAHCTAVFCAVPPNRFFSSRLNLTRSFSFLSYRAIVSALIQMLSVASQVPATTYSDQLHLRGAISFVANPSSPFTTLPPVVFTSLHRCPSETELQIKRQIMTDNRDDVCRAFPCQPKAYKILQKIGLLKVTANVSGSSFVPLIAPVACAPHLRDNKSVDLRAKREKFLAMKLTVKRSSRRLFMSQSSAALATISILPSHVLGLNGATPPSERLNIAGIGAGGQGAG